MLWLKLHGTTGQETILLGLNVLLELVLKENSHLTQPNDIV